jgi:putative nucleotidyltransferase with HDIG domain
LPILAANLGILGLSAVAGNLPFALLRVRFTGLNGWFLMAVVAGSLLYFVVNAGLVSLLVSRRQKVPAARLWRENYGWMAPRFIFTAACGGLMGGAYLTMGWVALPVFVLPLVFMYRNSQLHIRRSRQAYETAEQGRRALEDAHTLQTKAMDHLIEAVSAIIDARDRSVAGHSFQVARYAVAIGEQMGLSGEELLHLRQAALLHDLGKVGIPEAILQKPARLTPEEWEVMKQHTQIGERILRSIPGLAETAQIVGQHHEKYGGKGYPYGLVGDQIALGARIVALCDALDTMLSDRPYSRAKPLAWAIEEIDRCTGEHFDPKVVAAFRVLVARQSQGFFVNSAVEGYPMDGLAEVAAAIQR